MAGVDPTRTGLTPIQARVLAKAKAQNQWDHTASLMHNAYMVVPGKKKKLKVQDFHPFHAKAQKTRVTLNDMKVMLDKGTQFAKKRPPQAKGRK